MFFSYSGLKFTEKRTFLEFQDRDQLMRRAASGLRAPGLRRAYAAWSEESERLRERMESMRRACASLHSRASRL